MKKNRLLPILILLISSLAFQGCTDWLNVNPREEMTEGRAFSTELLTNSVLNGIYRDLSWSSLYGGSLTWDFTEYLARYYFFATGTGVLLAPFNSWGQVAQWNYGNDYVRPRIAAIWNSAYQLIMRLNVFIDNMEQLDERIMRESRRQVLIGEAHALRAFLHFDIYRLFGPVHITDAHGGLPYNNRPYAAVHQRLPVTEFIDLVLEDLETALELLINDPIRTYGVNDDHREIVADASLTQEDIFAEFYRNRRMNYFAVRALQTRVLLHVGRYIEAENAAQETLNAIREQDTFEWVSVTDARRNDDWVFYREVLFGVNNPRLHYNWERTFNRRQAGSSHLVTRYMLLNNFFPEFAVSAVADVVTDVRADQWILADVVGYAAAIVPVSYVSTKFREPHRPPLQSALFLHYMQPLLRMSELYLTLVETALHRGDVPAAATALNTLLTRRGYPVELLLGFESPPTEAEVRARLERNVYLEFVGEGQAFFFLKRNNKSLVFNPVIGGHTFRPGTYVLPLPRTETDIF